MAISHECHQGFIKTKSLLKEKVWFPDMDRSVKELLSNCMPCLAAGSGPPVEPIKMTSMPEHPWEKLHLDFKGPLPGGKYLLVLIDRYTRYPEVEIISNINCNIVTRKLRRSSATHGIPKTIVTDNGPPFHSNGFKKFMNEFGINHQFQRHIGLKETPKLEGSSKLYRKC